MKLGIAMLVCSVMTVAGCGAAQQNADTLQESILNYNEGVRWERFESAATSLPPRERTTFVDDMDARAKDLKVSQYDVVAIDKPRRNTAKVHIKVAWYKDSEGTLRETHAMQTWERHGKEWWMVEERRMRGDEMPGLAEKLDVESAAADKAADKTPEVAPK